ncbi:hypothetical protein HZA86_04345 [Candidatus Uhrbacteria bacterium]|nr:hypothetical protein [Candidatus Uhrbacteria bacterium]
MALTVTQQLVSAIDRSHRVVIAVAAAFSVDAIASSLALARTLIKKEKDVRLVCHGWDEAAKKQFGFLPDHNRILPILEHLHRYAILMNTTNTPIEEISYELKDHTLAIYVNPRSGTINKDQLTVEDKTEPIDLIITIGSADIASLGPVATQEPDLFYSTPLLNIDNAVENEHHGQWQLIDVTSPSIAEIVLRMHDVLGIELVDADTATLLLTGIIAATRSFSIPNVTPATLTAASRLMTMGGKREEIVQRLYWKRSVGTLKLFGKILGRLHHDEQRKIGVGSVTMEDLLETKTQIADVHDVAEEVFHTSPDIQLMLLLYPNTEGSWQALALSRKIHLLELLSPYKPSGNPHRASFIVNNRTVTEVQKELWEYLQEHAKANGIVQK